jgi:hypothetical protein
MKVAFIRFSCVSIAIAQVLDIYTTNKALAEMPGAVEGNPVMAFSMYALGEWWWLVKAAAVIWLIWMTVYAQPDNISRLRIAVHIKLLILYAAVLANNIFHWI